MKPAGPEGEAVWHDADLRLPKRDLDANVPLPSGRQDPARVDQTANC